MFNNNSYNEVNREERHFGFLFGSAIIHDQNFAQKIFDRYNSIFGSDLDAKSFDIFFEVAALRDYWHALGNTDEEYHKITHPKRRIVINTILEDMDYDPAIIDQYGLFWTNGNIGTGKLWCPSEWNIHELERIPIKKKKLVTVRWCFNAKPDILIVSNKSAVFIEVKIESGGGRSNSGYDQLKIQKQISDLMILLIPEYTTITFHNSSLTLHNELSTEGEKIQGIKWLEVIGDLKSTMRKNPGSIYVHKCLSELLRYYK